MHRQHAWEERAARYLEEIRARPFVWGEHDCVSYCAGAIEAMTGESPLPADIPGYSTALGSLRALKKLGYDSVADAVDARFVRVPPALAHRGDIVMTGGSVGLLWVTNAVRYAIMLGEEAGRDGLLRIPSMLWVDPVAWRVPYEPAA